MVGVVILLGVLITLATSWASFGAVFYQRATPFYDSLSYQQSYVATARDSASNGRWGATVAAWKNPNVSAVLYRLFAAGFGGELADGKEGLYVYLNTIHLTAILALIFAAWQVGNSLPLALWALAAWLSATPLTQAVSGILDQRMDLASGSFCLAVAALMFVWSRQPSISSALFAGTVATFAVLHRPVMVVTVVAIMVLFVGRTWLRERFTPRFWWVQGAVLAAPLLIIALPWMIGHRAQLYGYYVTANVDVGSARSWQQAAAYNLNAFAGHFGLRYGCMLFAGGVWAVFFRKVDWLDSLVICVATAVPLLLLIISKSVGNFIVCQTAIAIPALLLACSRPKTGVRWANHAGWVVIASVALVWAEDHGLRALQYQVATRSTEARVQSLQVIAQIASIEVGPPRRLAGFQASPLDPLALCVIAADQGFSFQAGTRIFHPTDFGLSNETARQISDDDMRAAVGRTLENLRGADNLLMVPVPSATLPTVPFSHTKMDVIRQAVAANPAFERQITTRPIQGVSFDIYSIKPR